TGRPAMRSSGALHFQQRGDGIGRAWIRCSGGHKPLRAAKVQTSHPRPDEVYSEDVRPAAERRRPSARPARGMSAAQAWRKEVLMHTHIVIAIVAPLSLGACFDLS